jgi:amino acid adenylation domain-containing protein
VSNAAQAADMLSNFTPGASSMKTAESVAPSGAMRFPQSFAQQRLWFLNQLDSASAAYNVVEAFRLEGALDDVALERSVNALVARHESLRTTFSSDEGTPIQIVAPSLLMQMARSDLDVSSTAAHDEAIALAVRAEASTPFDLEHGPLLRCTLLRIAAHEHVLVIAMHHIISEGGWSMAIFLRELEELYDAEVHGRPARLPVLDIQYADYALWQREQAESEAFESHLAYWRDRLANAPGRLELPTDHARPELQSSRGARRSIVLADATMQRVHALARAERATSSMVLLAAWLALLARYAEQDDLVVGMPVAGRSRVETENVIGLFVNTLAIRADLSGDPSFATLLARVRITCMEAFDHQDVPLERIVAALRPDRGLSHAPLFQVIFAPQNTPREPLNLHGLVITPIDADTGSAMLDLTLFVSGQGRSTRLVAEFATDLFEGESIDRMLRQLQTLLDRAVTNPHQALSEIDALDDDERHMVLVTWNDAPCVETSGTIHGRFALQAARAPERRALVAGQTSMTYGELHQHANALAHRLQAAGVRVGDRVAILMDRSFDLVTAIVGTLYAGAVYVPIDRAYPRERITWLLRDAGARVLLTQGHLVGELPSFEGIRLCIDDAHATTPPDEPVHADVGPDDLAYIMYTSGSTGEPNGVEIPHRAVLRLVLAPNYVQLDADRVLLQLAPVSFDASTFELWGALLHGATGVLAPMRVPSAGELQALIAEHGIDTMWLTSSLFNALVDDDPTAFRGLAQLLIGGEALSVPHVRRALEAAPEMQLINGYGPTETTTFACCHSIARPLPPNVVSIPIGRPISGTSVYILSARGRPVPIGVPGELHIGGAGLARGYHSRPELTARKFIEGNEAAGRQRLYRTGDRVRYRSGGVIEFLGRLDGQVKVRGYRIEPAEIEAVLAEHEAVREVAVVAREEDAGGKRLVAYVALRSDLSNPPATLRSWLQQRLPDYMVPSSVEVLSRLPLTPSGKIDRRSLPAPSTPAHAPAPSQGPRTSTELQLRAIWEEVLGLAPIGVHENFFELGGHSLLAVRMFSRIRSQLGRNLPLTTLFRSPTIAELATLLEAESDASHWSPLVVLQPEGSLPPLFIIHEGGGTVLRFRDLARHLAPEQPVYALQAVALSGTRPPHESIEEMAACYIHEIRIVQPSGPYYIAGASFGGIVAYEMAQQLVAQQQRVAVLALLDSSLHPRHMVSRVARMRFQSARVALHVRRLFSNRYRSTYIYDRSRSVWQTALMRSGWGVSAWRAEGVTVMPSTYAEVWDAARRAYRAYEPREYSGRVTLFRARVRDPGCPADPAPEWKHWCRGGVEIRDIPGGHVSLMIEPNVATLARELRDALRHAREGT